MHLACYAVLMIVVALLRFHYGRQNRLRAKRLGESGGQAARDAALVHSFEDRTDMVRFIPVIFLSFHIYIYISFSPAGLVYVHMYGLTDWAVFKNAGEHQLRIHALTNDKTNH